MGYKTRDMVQDLDKSPILQVRLIIALVLIYFIELSIFVLSLEKLTIAPLLTPKGLILILYTLCGLGLGMVSAIYLASMAFWLVAKCFQGEGSLAQTRAAVIATTLWSVPISFFILLIYFSIKQPWLGLPVRVVSYFAILATTIYGFIVLFHSLAEVHRFALWRAFSAAIVGILGLIAFVFVMIGQFSKF